MQIKNFRRLSLGTQLLIDWANRKNNITNLARATNGKCFGEKLFLKMFLLPIFTGNIIHKADQLLKDALALQKGFPIKQEVRDTIPLDAVQLSLF